MKPDELSGRAREFYDSWRGLGLSEAEALREVEESGIELEEQLFDQFKRMGMAPDAARYAAQGRRGKGATLMPSPLGKSFPQKPRVVRNPQTMAPVFTRGKGMTLEAAAPTNAFDEAVALFQSSGMSEAAARYAAAGRDRSEREARQDLAESASSVSGTGVPPIVARTDELVRQGMSEADARRKAYQEIHGKPVELRED